MAKDVLFTNGVIAAREKYFLKDKLIKLCECGAEETLRTLTECGFGRGAEVSSVYDYELLVADDEKSIDDFIREYSPSEAEKAYLLAPRDFHNAKALVKARFFGLEESKLLAPEGLIPVQLIRQCIYEGGVSLPVGGLSEAVAEAVAALTAESGEASGSEIGNIFERAQYRYLSGVCSKNRLLKKLLAAKADMTNILTAVRSSDSAEAEKAYVAGGKLTLKQLARISVGEGERTAEAFFNTPYKDFVGICLENKSAGLPLTEAERMLESYEMQYFAERKYELEKNQPFLYYVFRRRAENADVRILFVCQLAGMSDVQIRSRLRAF